MVKKNNRLLWYLAGAAGALLLFVIIGKQAGWLGSDEGVKVSAVKAEKRTVTETVSANGKIQPEVEVKISSDVSGEVTDLFIKEGDSVKAGQLLARVDPELYQSALDRAGASLNNSKANLANSKARQLQAEARFTDLDQQFARNKKLHDQKLISDAEFETAQSNYQSGKAEVEAAKQTVLAAQYTIQSMEASLKEAKKNLARTEIFSPVNGIVSKLNIEKGERVVGTSQMAGTEMMRIANLNDMEVSVDVNENDIVKVNKFDTAIIEVDAYNNRKFKGVVTELANSATTSAATTSDQVTNFIVKIRILRSSYGDLDKGGKTAFRPGMSASVEIQTETARDVITVPIEAVTVRDRSELDSAGTKKPLRKRLSTDKDNKKEEEEMVFVCENDVVRLRKVKSGVQDDKYIQVIEGLSENDEVVTGPYSAISRTLKNGDKIKRVSKEELFDMKKPDGAPKQD